MDCSKIRHTFLTLFFAFILCSCQDKKPTINIAVASNFESTLKLIVGNFKSQNKAVDINIISSSSGVLANQILNDAPYDLFMSADKLKPEIIYSKLNLKIKPQEYAIGKLALWIPNSSGQQCIQKLHTLKTLAIANPKIAPYGKVAQTILDHNNIKIEKHIQTSNATQAFIYIKDKLTEGGFAPYSLVKGQENGCIEIFEDKELSQYMLLLDPIAADLYDYILTDKVRKLIKTSGYQ